ncbi:putative virion core protein (lumpy skin disease virus) [Desulfitobacterium dehalogenans ATCC 51507]|uniref:Putative virion core protein (Lumpy skin disease virus) n=1 Tax=Desulfitobacterium dehalogenans (strain ATCC 51507 / DSM 9161 / JW/IU-DC1) TaxID=756499 RepID=I4AA92_DESDJ|nr:SPFH domain-containing protein [Desulfitobacterium dehalogenans]AFM00877.1 putative virion core protein (lumpy skin disease virus) [Desulfitobacterium dehalogenans ATCC 51507]
MGFFSGQFSNVVEWEEFREDMIFWKWHNREIKRGSKLIIRPGQDAIFLFNGRIEGIFKDEGDYDIESQIVPFLSTLKGFKFGFNSGMRAEVLFVNTKEFTVKWGTKSAINIPVPQLPGGMPIRANGTFTFKVNDYVKLIDKIAGVKDSFLVEDVKLRIMAMLDQLLMKWIVKEGKDMFNLQSNSFAIANCLKTDLDMQIYDMGITVTEFTIMSFTYPEEIQQMIAKTASHTMIGDMGRYQQVSVLDGISGGRGQGGSAASDMAGMVIGMQMANEMMRDMSNPKQEQVQEKDSSAPKGGSEPGLKKPNFCPNCGQKTEGANFCSNCGQKLV